MCSWRSQPLDGGARLATSSGLRVWHLVSVVSRFVITNIVYTWVLMASGFRFFFAVRAVPLLSACNVCNILFVSVCHVNPFGGWFCHCSEGSRSACHFIAEGLPVSYFIACTPVGIRVRRSGLLSCRVYHGFSDLGFASVCTV